MSCRQSNAVTRSYPDPVKLCAVATSNDVLSGTPASAARLRARSMDAGAEATSHE